MKKLKDLIQFEKKLEGEIQANVRKWTGGRLAGLGTFVLALSLGLALLISNQSSLLPTRSHRSVVWDSAATALSDDTAVATPVVTFRDGIPVTIVRDAPVDSLGLSMNSEVVLTDSLAEVAHAFNEYLVAHGQFAIITSGKRTPQDQLDIIKERIDEHGADNRFPKLDDATVADTKIWLRAWHWLVRRHVPVNAPEEVDGARVSMHTKGLAMDFIADNLDHARDMLAAFARSKYAKEAPMHITAIVREPGCVHINLG